MAGFQFPDEKDDKSVDEGTQAAEDAGGIQSRVLDEGPAVEVEVVDDAPPEDRGRKPLEREVEEPTEEELSGYSEKVKKRISELTHKTHDERRRADALQRERDELEQVSRRLLAERNAIQKQFKEGATLFAKQAEEALDVQIAQVKDKLRAAHDAFDTEQIVEAQSTLSELQARKLQVKNSAQGVARPEKDVVESDPTAQAPAPKLAEKTQRWLSQNPWFGESGDEVMTGFALGLHRKLVKEYGTQYANSDEYYSHIDAEMRKTFPAKFKSPSSERRPASVVAPAQRSVGAPRKVTLSATQVALAKKFGMTPQQYAIEVAKLTTEN